MGVFGNILGNALGSGAGQYFGGDAGRNTGGSIGGALGNFLPFKHGGRVTAHKIMGYARGGGVEPMNQYQRGGKVKKSKKKGKKRN